MPIVKCLELSTAHLSQADLDYLNKRALEWDPSTGEHIFYIPEKCDAFDSIVGELRIVPTGYGFIVFIPVDKSDKIVSKCFLAQLKHDGKVSDTFVAIIGYAIEQEAYIVSLDCDASEEPDLFKTPEE
jgi:hypothetical protein